VHAEVAVLVHCMCMICGREIGVGDRPEVWRLACEGGESASGKEQLHARLGSAAAVHR
jgi:hypothetical protein